jgi:glutamate synthase (NADPH) small chain
MSWEEIKLEIRPSVKQYLEMRHISEDEVKQVIHQAETTKEKLFQPDSGKFLAKLRIGKATFYVEYSQNNGSFIVESAYAHKSEIIG